MTTTDMMEESVETFPQIYFLSLAALMALFFMSGFLGLFVGNVSFAGTEWNLGLLVWTIGIVYFAAGFRVIDPENWAGVLVLGWPTIAISGKFVFTMPGISTLAVFTRGSIQIEIPTEPENIFRDEDNIPVPPGKKPPVRITFAQGTKKEDPLEQRITAEVSAFARYRIEKPWDFYVRIAASSNIADGNPYTEANKQLEDMIVSLLQERLTKMTVARAYKTLDKTNDALDNHLREKTSHWGIVIIDVRIKTFGFGHDLNRAIQKVPESKANKQSTINNAEAEKQRLVLEGEGRGKAIQAELDGRGDGLKNMATKLGVEPREVLGAETARDIGNSPSTKIVVGTDGLKQLVGAGVAIAESAKKE